MDKDNILKKMGERIKNKRNNLNYSQQKLADLTNYSDRTSIAKIEKGLVDLPLSKIREFAKVLKTTPAYLMGWENEEVTSTQKTERELMIEKYHLNEEELAEYDRITKLSIEMNALMFDSNNIELEEDVKKEMDFELSETLKKAFISSLISKRKKAEKR